MFLFWCDVPTHKQEKVIAYIQHEIDLHAEKITCKICLHEKVDRAFRPCGHLIACHSCAKQLKVCAVCRQRIQGCIIVVIPRVKNGNSGFAGLLNDPRIRTIVDL